MKGIFMLLLVCVITVLVGFTGQTRKEPPCKCEVTVYKSKRKGALPCIVGIMRDSATQKPFEVAAVVIDNIVLRTDKQGRTYCEVLSGKRYTLVAKAFTYYFCTQQVEAQDNDSIVCVFNMRRSRELHGPDVYLMRKPLFKRR